MSVQLGLGLNRRLGGFNPFNPTHLNPYLLFDTRTSMLGELESPTLDLDPATPSTLDVITATRSGVATYTDADGVIQTAPENTVRVDHVDGVPMMLIEPSATNLLPYSEDFSNSYWNTASASVAVDYGYLSPRGDLTASKVTKQTTNGHLFGNGVAGAKSIYIKGTAGETVHALDRYTDANTSITLTGEWQRVELDGVNVIFYAVDFRGGTATEVYIWGAQLETGSVATSYIPTSGSTVTRNGDDLVIDGAAFSDFYNPTEGTVYVESVGRKANTWIMSFNDTTWNNRMFMFYNPRVGLQVLDNNVQQVGANSIQSDDTGVLRSSAFTYKTNSVKFSCNGQTETNDTSATIPTVTRLMVGGANGAIDTYALNGHIKRLIYWPTHSDNL